MCDIEKNHDEVIEGLNGDICLDCLAVMQEIHGTVSTEQAYEKHSPLNFDIKSLKKELDKYVMGQEDAKRQLLVEMYKKYSDKSPENKANNNVYLIGDSGVGKTHVVKSLAKVLDVPFLEVDITSYSETGYKGNDVSGMLDPLVIQTQGDIEKIENSIVFIDEIDKIATASTSPNGQLSSTKVQQGLLKLIDGMAYSHELLKSNSDHPHPTVDPSQITFIAAGAHVGLDEIRKERLEPNKTKFVGFNTGTADDEESKLHDSKDYVGSDLIEFGMIPELVGRFPLVVELHKLTEEDIKNILLHNPDSILKRASATFEAQQIKLDISDDDIDWVVKETLKHPLGVRGIAHVVTKGLNDMLFDALVEGVTEVSLAKLIAKTTTTEYIIPETTPLEAIPEMDL